MQKKTEEVIEIIESEGLDYAITDYLSPESIEDKTLAKMWKDAEIALKTIKEYLGI
jgi:hypothetical protein